MREYLDASDIANSAMMAGGSGKTVLIVEGITDKRLYDKFLDPDVYIVIAHSKHNVVGAITLTSKRRKCDYVVGIVDADLDYLNYSPRPNLLFVTDARDSETMMFYSTAFDDVTAEYFDEEKAASFEKRNGSIRDAVVAGAYPVGILMYLSERYGWKFSFKNLDFESIVDRNTLRTDIGRLVSALTSDERYAPKRKEILRSLEEELGTERNPMHVCRGHDVMKIMALGLRNSFGSWNSRSMTDSALSGSFRLAYDMSDFSKTELYRKSGEWSKSSGRKLWKVIPP